LVLDDAKARDALEKLLLEPTYEGLPEAMRVKRAEALVVVARVKGCEWVGESVEKEVDGERSPVVRGVLAKVGKE
jgi:proteasome component ECM29